MLRLWLGVALLLSWIGLPAEAAQVDWCLQVVPSGELVMRYGASWCDD